MAKDTGARLDPVPEAKDTGARLDPVPEVAMAIADHQELEEEVDPRGLEEVDPRGLEEVDPRGLEEVDPRGLEEVDLEGPVAHRCEKAIQPRRNLHSPIAPDFHPSHFQ